MGREKKFNVSTFLHIIRINQRFYEDQKNPEGSEVNKKLGKFYSIITGEVDKWSKEGNF